VGAPQLLLTVNSRDELKQGPMSQLDVRASFHISEKGKEVSAGKGDFVEIHGIDLWQEGFISVNNHSLWRWDEQNLKLARQ